MSGSPKYSRARLRAAQERALREARRVASARERAWRAAEEQRRREERLGLARAEVTRELETLRQSVAVQSKTEAVRHVAAEFHELDRRFGTIRAALDSATSLADVQRAAREYRRVGDQIGQVLARGQAAAFAAGKSEVESALVELRQRADALDRPAAERFDPQALPELKTLLDDAEDALSRQAPAKARYCIDLARARLERHLADTQAQYGRWAEARNHSLARLADMSDRVAGLRADPVVLRWQTDRIRAFERGLDLIRSSIQEGNFAAADREAADLESQIEPLIQSAQETQLQEDRRAYIVSGIVQVMGQLGFVVQAGSPTLEDPGRPGSATIIHARRVGGGAVAVSVPQEGDLWYDIDGFPKLLKPAADGRLAPTCDEAEAQIQRMHEALEQGFGIEMGELLWEGKAPRPDRKQAERLPDGQAVPRRAEGLS